MRKYGKPPSKPVLTHVKREIMQKVWELLLDKDDDYGYNHNRLVHGNEEWDSGMGENDEEDDWESMYID